MLIGPAIEAAVPLIDERDLYDWHFGWLKQRDDRSEKSPDFTKTLKTD
jgi:hypothetical protein